MGFLKRTQNTVDTERLMTKELGSRITGVKRQVVHTLAQETKTSVQNKSPDKDPELKNYTDDLGVKQVKGKKAAYAVVHEGDPNQEENNNPKVTVLYVREIPEPKNRWGRVFRALGEYGPFVLDMWPVTVPKDKTYVFTRTVKEREVVQIRERNLRQFGELVKAVSEFGIRHRRTDLPNKNKNIDVKHDLAFSVLRRELGVGVPAKPHWRPGIKASKSASVLEKIASDPLIFKSLNDVSYRGFYKLGMINDKATAAELEVIKDFQDKILGSK